MCLGNRPVWREHYAKQRTETQAFKKREKRLLGKLENAVAAVRMSKELAASDKGQAQASLFNFLTNSKTRADALERLQAAQTRKLGAKQSAEVGAAISKIKKAQQKAYKSHREQFNAKREALKADQATDKQEMRQKWQERHQERSRVLEVVSRMKTLKKERQATQEVSRGKQRAEFNKAARGKRRRKSLFHKELSDFSRL